jgi:hypothetical protein
MSRVAMFAMVGGVLAGLLLGCSSPSSPSSPARGGTHGSSPNTGATGASSPSAHGSAKYRAAVDAAASRHLSVWLESDLVRRWREGPASLAEAVAKLAKLGARPGVVGVKIADELGQDDGLVGDRQVLAFLADASSAVRRALPGKRVLIDMVVPELGCVPGVTTVAAQSAGCAAAARSRWPGTTVAIADAVVRSGDIDVLDLSTGLRTNSYYAAFGLDRDAAQRAAWAEVDRLGWAQHVTLQARKALAQAGGYPADDAQAAADLNTWVDTPLASGAQAVDVWTWHQPYRGGTAMLMSPGLSTNALWRGLLERKADRGRLITHFSPSSTELSLTQDLDRLAEVFGSVFIAAGTG